MTEDRRDWRSNGKRKKPCGFRGDPRRQCHCNPLAIERYMGRISGPLLDRMDIHIEVPAVPFRELSDKSTGTTSATMREQVLRARDLQTRRLGQSSLKRNGRMSPAEIRRHCTLEPEAESLLKQAMEQMGLSARAHDKILRIARTIADLDDESKIGTGHLSEAINYRALDRSYWQ